jgi:hypothetical protein
MPSPLSGPGLGLPLPQNQFPSELNNSPYDLPSNKVCLAAGDEMPIDAGTFFIDLGGYLLLEFLDPVTGLWQPGVAGSWAGAVTYVKSDGFNVRVANRLGCPVGGVVTAPGSSYVQASTSISVTGGGGSTWVPIIGGQLSMNTATIVTAQAGAGYGVAPIVMIPSPAPPANNANGVGGIQASGYASIASGTVSGFTFTNPGAGYGGTTFNVVALPNPTDPNLAIGITACTITFTVGSSGSITGVICTNPGAPLANPNNITLTVAGAGTLGTVTPIMLQTITSSTLVGGSTLAGAAGTLAFITSVGGYPPQGTFTNSENFLYQWGRPRPAQISATVAAGVIAAQTPTIYDGGLFYQAPSPVMSEQFLTATTGTVVGSSTIVFTMGSKPAVAGIQAAP